MTLGRQAGRGTLVLAVLAVTLLHAGALQAQEPGERASVSMQPAERGIRLQTDWSGYRLTIAPEATAENQLSLGGAVAGVVSSGAAAGLVFTVGPDKRDLLVNSSWRIGGDHRLFASFGQLRQAIALSIADTITDVTLTQYAGGLAYDLLTPRWKLDTLGAEIYGSRSRSRALGEVEFTRDTGTEYELFSTPARVAGASIVGLAMRASVRPWTSGRLGFTFGRERVTYDFHAGDDGENRLTSRMEWSQQVAGAYTLTARASRQSGQQAYEVGVARSTGRQQFGFSVTTVRGHDNGLRDTQLRWSHSVTFGSAASTSGAPSSANGPAAPARTLLDEVSRRPRFVPAQVVAQADTTVPRERRVAIVRSGLPPGARVDTATGVVTLPQPVSEIVAITRNQEPFDNTGQFVIAGDRLEVRAAAMTIPATGVTDEYVVTLTNPSGGVTMVAVAASAGSVRIDGIAVTTAARQEMPDPVVFGSVVEVPVDSLVVSEAVTVTGINVPVTVSVRNGELAIDDGTFGSLPTPIRPGQRLRVRHRAAATLATRTVSDVVVGSTRTTFESMTQAGPAPAVFGFVPRLGVRPGDDVTSDPATMAGLAGPSAVRVAGGMYAIDDGAFTTAPGTIRNGQQLRLRAAAASTPATTTMVTVLVGSGSAVFSVTTEGADEDPDPFELRGQTADPDATVDSAPITITGINARVSIVVDGGAYSVNGGSYSTTRNDVGPGDQVVVRAVAATTPGATATATLTVGTRSAAFTVTTRDITPTPVDTVPDAFSFAARTGVTVKTSVDSDTITVTGIDAAAPISVAGGEYAVGGGAFVDTAGEVAAGQTVTVRVRSSAQFSTTTTATLTIGGVSAGFSVTTEAADTTPEAFSFASETAVAVNTVVISNSITIDGINTDVPITVSGGEYAIHGSYTSNAGTIGSGDTLRLRLTSSSQFSTTTAVTVTVGGVSATFSVTTEAEDTVPDAFGFSPLTNVNPGQTKQSEQIIVSGINAPAAIGVSGQGTSEYRVNNDAWTSTPGTVVDGDRVRVRHTAAATGNTTTTTTLTIGGASGSFSVTTK